MSEKLMLKKLEVERAKYRAMGKEFQVIVMNKVSILILAQAGALILAFWVGTLVG